MLVLRHSLFIAILIAITGPLGGCGFGANDIQFEGKVFDMIGMDKLTKAAPEPKLNERAPIVLPPEAKLPEPGKRVAVQQKDMQWPDDPDVLAKRARALEAQKIKEYCTGPARSKFDPKYDEKMEPKCGGLLSGMVNKTFDREEQ